MNVQKSGTSPKVSISNSDILNPFQPLSYDEIVSAAQIVKGHLGEAHRNYRFETIQLREPSSEELSIFNTSNRIVTYSRIN